VRGLEAVGDAAVDAAAGVGEEGPAVECDADVVAVEAVAAVDAVVDTSFLEHDFGLEVHIEYVA
jgi:hypothetical protein